MTLCKQCSSIEGGITTKVSDFETYEVCTQCGAEDSVININEDEYYSDLETEDRISRWKDEK